MPSLIIGISILALASAHGAFAQATPSTSPAPAGAQKSIGQEHPDWFESKGKYRPCPASVTFADGQNACLGCPTACRFHF
jgi:hypothetical protein